MTLPVPNGERSFVDSNGEPLAGGTIYTYVPGTTTPSPTYVDEGLTVPNPNPLTLDAAGRCIMWSAGLLRQVLQDQFGNLIWDQETGFSLDNYTGNFNLNGNLTVSGSSTFNGPVQDNSSLTVAGPTNLAGGAAINGLTVTGGANVTGGLTADSINDTGPLTVAGTTDLNGDLNVAGDTVMNGNDTIGGNLGVVGSSDLNGPTVTSSLGVTGNATIDGDLTVGGTITGGGGGTPTPVPEVQVLPIRIIGNVGSDTASSSDGLIVWEFGQGGVPDSANINFTLPTMQQGQVIYYKIGLLSYEGQSSVGESPLANVNWYANTIDGQAPPYNFEEAGVGTVFGFINVNGADDWLIFATG